MSLENKRICGDQKGALYNKIYNFFGSVENEHIFYNLADCVRYTVSYWTVAFFTIGHKPLYNFNSSYSQHRKFFRITSNPVISTSSLIAVRIWILNNRSLNKFSLFLQRWQQQYSVHGISNSNAHARKYCIQP